jgi:hypothetical protein
MMWFGFGAIQSPEFHGKLMVLVWLGMIYDLLLYHKILRDKTSILIDYEA